jgi:hypothetical protein
MAERRALVDALKQPAPPVDPKKEKSFVFGDKEGKGPELAAATATVPAIPPRVPLSTRMRGDYASALKRASLERQLNGVEPNTLTDILEQAVEPWLRANGYLK